jgi:predicted nucleic acid-binding protein
VATLNELWEMLDRHLVSEDIVRHAGELAERRALRGFDAIHLASAITLLPEIALACWDQQLSKAARSEGVLLATA